MAQMKRTARVIEKDGKLVAEVRRTDACGHCHACGLTGNQSVYYDLPEGKFAPGDEVSVDAPQGALGKATLLAYGLPLICLVAGLLLGTALFDTEWAQALTAIIALAAGYTLLKLTERKRRASGEYECGVSNPDQQKEEPK